MTKDWDAVQRHIRELSVNQKKSLADVKSIMESKHSFRASTRAYRLKLKEWGYMRHKRVRRASFTTARNRENSQSDETLSDCRSISELSPNPATQAEDELTTVLKAVCSANILELEALLSTGSTHERINHPVGLPFKSNGPLHSHAVLQNCILLEHPGQKVLDIASALPSSAVLRLLINYGATPSIHPLGTDLALHNAIKNGKASNVEILLKAGSSPNGLPDCTWRPLRQAAFWDCPTIVRILLDHGADVDPPLDNVPFKSPLQLVLDRRAAEYENPKVRETSEEILRMLLYADAKVVADASDDLDGRTPFETFLEPWQKDPQWSTNLSSADYDCLQYFVTKGAGFHVEFNPSLCAADGGHTFEHQILWHAEPAARGLLIDHANVGSRGNGTNIIHEIVGTCSEAKRHPADTIRDMRILLKRGSDPDAIDGEGYTPLTRCLEFSPSADVLERINLLLRYGKATSLLKDASGRVPVFMAIRLFTGSLQLQLAESLVSHYKISLGANTDWLMDYFPIADGISCEEVQKYTFNGPLKTEVYKRLPRDVRYIFQKAALSAATRKFLDGMAHHWPTSSYQSLQILNTLKTRQSAGLPEYEFSQTFVLQLLEFVVGQPIENRLSRNVLLNPEMSNALTEMRLHLPASLDQPEVLTEHAAPSSTNAALSIMSEGLVEETRLYKTVTQVHYQCLSCGDGELYSAEGYSCVK